MDKSSVAIRDTQYGFVYGPVQIVRMFDDRRGVMIGLADAAAEPHEIHTQIWVSAKGRSVRVYKSRRSPGKRLRGKR